MKTVTKALEFIPEINIKGICSPEEMLFFDIETTGLKKETSQVYLIGCAYYSGESWYIRQWLAQSGQDEEYLLEDFLDFASGFHMLVHFNGDGFDIPYINYKADYYMLGSDLGRFKSFDIYKSSRVSRKLLDMSSMSQKSIELFLGISRDDRFNGGQLIPVYFDYERTGSFDAEQTLLLHNFDDLQGMLKILPVLSYSGIFEGAFRYTDHEIIRDKMMICYRLDQSVPAAFDRFVKEAGGADVRICAEKDQLRFEIPVYDCEAKLYLEPVSDYYYLPELDSAVHKDIAKLTDKANRVKANRKNCYIRKSGRFIPAFCSWQGKIYRSSGLPEKELIDLEELEKTDKMSIYHAMAADILAPIASC